MELPREAEVVLSREAEAKLPREAEVELAREAEAELPREAEGGTALLLSPLSCCSLCHLKHHHIRLILIQRHR
jgi:hypothetical protein